jgi:hypothetical protein
LPKQEAEDPKFLVDPENWDAVETFCRCATQWSYGVMGGVIGLIYPDVKTVLDLTQPKKRHRELFLAIQIMEQAALEIFNSKSK